MECVVEVWKTTPFCVGLAANGILSQDVLCMAYLGWVLRLTFGIGHASKDKLLHGTSPFTVTYLTPSSSYEEEGGRCVTVNGLVGEEMSKF